MKATTTMMVKLLLLLLLPLGVSMVLGVQWLMVIVLMMSEITSLGSVVVAV